MTTYILFTSGTTSRSLITRLTSFATTSHSPSLASTSSSSSSSISKSCKTCHYKFNLESNKENQIVIRQRWHYTTDMQLELNISYIRPHEVDIKESVGIYYQPSAIEK